MRMVDARASTTLAPNHHFQAMFRNLILDQICVLNYFRPKFRSNKRKLGPNSGSSGFELRANFGRRPGVYHLHDRCVCTRLPCDSDPLLYNILVFWECLESLLDHRRWPAHKHKHDLAAVWAEHAAIRGKLHEAIVGVRCGIEEVGSAPNGPRACTDPTPRETKRASACDPVSLLDLLDRWTWTFRNMDGT